MRIIKEDKNLDADKYFIKEINGIRIL